MILDVLPPGFSEIRVQLLVLGLLGFVLLLMAEVGVIAYLERVNDAGALELGLFSTGQQVKSFGVFCGEAFYQEHVWSHFVPRVFCDVW